MVFNFYVTYFSHIVSRKFETFTNMEWNSEIFKWSETTNIPYPLISTNIHYLLQKGSPILILRV